MSDAAKIMLDAPEWHEIERRLNAYDDMLAALKAGLVEAERQDNDPEDPTEFSDAIIEQMRAAIAKAEDK